MLLPDTNILIPLESSSPTDLVPNAKLAADFHRAARRATCGFTTSREAHILQDKDANRGELRPAGAGARIPGSRTGWQWSELHQLAGPIEGLTKASLATILRQSISKPKPTVRPWIPRHLT